MLWWEGESKEPALYKVIIYQKNNTYLYEATKKIQVGKQLYTILCTLNSKHCGVSGHRESQQRGLEWREKASQKRLSLS